MDSLVFSEVRLPDGEEYQGIAAMPVPLHPHIRGGGINAAFAQESGQCIRILLCGVDGAAQFFVCMESTVISSRRKAPG